MPAQEYLPIDIKQLVIFPGEEKPAVSLPGKEQSFVSFEEALSPSEIRGFKELSRELALHSDKLRLHYGYYLITQQRELYLAVAQDSEVVGMMTVLEAHLEGHDTGPVGILYDGLVFPDYRRRGVGITLLSGIIATTKAKNASGLFTPVETLCASLPRDPLPAHHLLLKCGFEYTSGRERYEYELRLTEPETASLQH